MSQRTLLILFVLTAALFLALPLFFLHAGAGPPKDRHGTVPPSAPRGY